MLRAMIVLSPEFMGAKQRLSRMYNMWKAVLAPRVEASGKEQRDAIEMELRMRSEVPLPLQTLLPLWPHCTCLHARTTALVLTGPFVHDVDLCSLTFSSNSAREYFFHNFQPFLSCMLSFCRLWLPLPPQFS